MDIKQQFEQWSVGMTRRKASAIVGGLGYASKPGWTYGLPARACHVGSRLRTVPGSVCSKCYGCAGRYIMPCVRKAQERRLQCLDDMDWAFAMAWLINHTGSPWFRWHDSGDIQSITHLGKIFQVCDLTPNVMHWLPTKEYGMLSLLDPEDVPPNLCIRLSLPMIDQHYPEYSRAGECLCRTVTSQGTCPAILAHDSCESVNCRKCWDRACPTVDYKLH